MVLKTNEHFELARAVFGRIQRVPNVKRKEIYDIYPDVKIMLDEVFKELLRVELVWEYEDGSLTLGKVSDAERALADRAVSPSTVLNVFKQHPSQSIKYDECVRLYCLQYDIPAVMVDTMKFEFSLQKLVEKGDVFHPTAEQDVFRLTE
jgi:hypothetical protein